LGACAAFDRVAQDAVIAHGVAPAGTQSDIVAVGEVEECIEAALDAESCEVSVSASNDTSQGGVLGGIEVPISPLFTTFTCTLTFTPWPASFVIAGVSFDNPGKLTHERRITVDRYRPGVVV